ncbi:MarR family transcriptional regulator, partial [Streptomyces olivochromogenes]
IARFLDFISESIIRAAEQAREVLHTTPETTPANTPQPDPDHA